MNEHQAATIYDIPVNTMENQITTLSDYRGQVLLIVNVASRCGFTTQYKELETLFQHDSARGFSVLGFPCDQFLHQEPGSNQEILAFATSCFRVTFPMFAKIDVRGPNQAPLYGYLAKHIRQKNILPLVPWNFTKILVDAQGNVLKRYLPTTSFKVIQNEIDALLS